MYMVREGIGLGLWNTIRENLATYIWADLFFSYQINNTVN